MSSSQKKYSRIVYLCVAMVFILFCFFLSNIESKRVEAGTLDNNVIGWIWSENYGWASLNAANFTDDSGADYGLNMEKKNDPISGDNYLTLTGWAWVDWNSESYSGNTHDWICFGEACKETAGSEVDWGAGGSAVPPAGELSVVIAPPDDEGLAEVTAGWARILSLGRYGNNDFQSNDWGWMSLTDRNHGGTGDDYKIVVDFESRELGGYAWNGGGTDNRISSSPVEVEEAGLGWFKFHQISLETGIVPVVVRDSAGNPLANATVLTDPDNYQCITNNNGACNIAGVRFREDPSAPGNYFSYQLKAVAEGYAVGNAEALITPEDPTATSVTFSLALVAEGENSVAGIVRNDSGRPLVGALVYAGSGQSTITRSDGSFTIANLDSSTPVLSAIAKGYQSQELSAAPYEFSLVASYSYAGEVVEPWLQTLMGDLHVNDPTSAFGEFAPPLGYGSATYVVSTEADSIYHFRSWAKDYDPDPKNRREDWIIDSYTIGAYPEQAVSHFGDVAIDVTAEWLSAQEMTTEEFSDFCNYGAMEPGGKYRFGSNPGSVNLPNIIAYTGESCGIGENAKTLVVDGDLYIYGDMDYTGGVFGKEQQPSLGLLVSGNVYIDGNVHHTVGSWYIEGDVYTEDPEVESEILPWYHEGLIVAGGYHFQREYVNESEIDDFPTNLGIASLPFALPNGETTLDFARFESPAEIIFYDGRVLINAPPGFGNLSSISPAWQDAIPR